MASIHEYNSLPQEKRRAYLASLSNAERDHLLSQMQASVDSKSAPAAKRTPSTSSANLFQGSTPWTRNQMAIMVIWILAFPLSGFFFFVASQLQKETREQGFTLLTVTFAWCLLFGFALGFLLSLAGDTVTGY